MTNKQKKVFYRIILSAILLVGLIVWNKISPMNEMVYRVLVLIPYLIIGYDILKKAGLGIYNKQVFDESFLMSVATIGAMILGETTEGVAVMLFYQIGELFQSIAVGKSRKSIASLMDIRPDYANIEEDGNLVQVDPDDVEIGTMIVVKPGERIPIDGIICEGSSSLNTSALTGESLPRDVTVGDQVISGCVNNQGLLKIKTTKEFGESTVSKILDMVENSSMKKAKAENFITKFARYYTPGVCYSALALAILPPLILGLLGRGWNWSTWIIRALTFLVISCPCALVVSIPLSFFGGIGGASRKGILVKGSNYLEALADAKTIVFDKTGTLTKGVFEVAKVYSEKNLSEEELLKMAANVEQFSNHPVATSIKKALSTDDWQEEVESQEEIAGLGVIATIHGKKRAVGNEKLMKQLQVSFKPIDEIGTLLYVAEDGIYQGAIVIRDVMKEEAKEALDTMRQNGIERLVLLSGDHEKVAKEVSEKLGITEYHAELLPGDKVKCVEEILAQKKEKEVVCFVGDGMNDAPVLSRVDVGIAMGALGSDAAIEAADVVLMDDNIAKIPLAIRIAKKCLRIVKENVVFALLVKFACLILGAFGIANMWWAVFADVGVMVLAVLNATRTMSIL